MPKKKPHEDTPHFWATSLTTNIRCNVSPAWDANLNRLLIANLKNVKVVVMKDVKPFRHARSKTTSDVDHILADLESLNMATSTPLTEPHTYQPCTFLLDMLVDPTVAHDFVANYEEVYAERWSKHSVWKQRLIWYAQVAWLIGNRWAGPLFALFDRVRKFTGG